MKLVNGAASLAVAAMALGLALAALAIPTAAQEPAARPDGLYAVFTTSKGTFVARLEPHRAPLATASFVGLAEGTIANEAFGPGQPFYDGTVFHRVVPGHVIQAGAPASDRARGPGYTYANEIDATLSHDHAGALGIANGGPHTNGSQFYVTLGDRSYLDGDYIVFGEVIEGMDVVFAIVQGDAVERVRIVRVGADAGAFRPDTASFARMQESAAERAAANEAARAEAERQWVAEAMPDAAWMEAPDPAPLSEPRLVRYHGRALRWMGHLRDYAGPQFVELPFVSGEDGRPCSCELSATFELGGAIETVTPGIDAVVAVLAPGESRTVVIPAELAFGRGGFYGPDVPGQPRFVIPPNTLLVVTIEVLPS